MNMNNADAHIQKADFTLSQKALSLRNPELLRNPQSSNLLDLTLFVSCYNESAYIVNTLNAVSGALAGLKLDYEIIIIDDTSKDDSVEVVKRYIAEHPDLNIILRANLKNKGWAQNYFDAVFMGTGKYFRAVCGDNSEPTDTLKAIFSVIGDADIIVPYYTEVKGKSKNREVVSACFTFLVNLITGNSLKYYNGMAVYQRYYIMRWHPNTNGFGFQADLLCLMLDKGFSYKEIPLTAAENRREKSNAITIKNVLSVIHTLLDITLRRLSNWLYK